MIVRVNGIVWNRNGYWVEKRAYHHMHAIRFYKNLVYRIVGSDSIGK
jgi:hypothetical protein